MHKQHIVTTDDLVGEIRDFPLWVVQLMCEEQWTQENDFDPGVFAKFKKADFNYDGFDWVFSRQGRDAWDNFISHGNIKDLENWCKENNWSFDCEENPEPVEYTNENLIKMYAEANNLINFYERSEMGKKFKFGDMVEYEGFGVCVVTEVTKHCLTIRNERGQFNEVADPKIARLIPHPDTVRLNWFEENKGMLMAHPKQHAVEQDIPDYQFFGLTKSSGDTLRECIDNAIIKLERRVSK